MTDYNHKFFKFMSDIIESGTWARLSAAARALYPVLCKFSDENFKYVWPGTEELLRLTGFKSKKSLQEARRELQEMGLIDVVPGTGRSTSRYYFRFDYTGSGVDIDSYRSSNASRRGATQYPPGGSEGIPVGSASVTPNQININIHQKDSNKQDAFFSGLEGLVSDFLKRSNTPVDRRQMLVESLMQEYGQLEIGEAVKIAVQKGKDGDIRYLEGILRNRKNSPPLTKNNQDSSGKGNQGEGSVIQNFRKSLPKELAVWLDLLQFRYSYRNIFYFAQNDNVPAAHLEEIFKEKGFEIRIFKADESEKFVDNTGAIEKMS